MLDRAFQREMTIRDRDRIHERPDQTNQECEFTSIKTITSDVCVTPANIIRKLLNIIHL